MNNKKTKKTLKRTLFYTVLAGGLFFGSNIIRNPPDNSINKDKLEERLGGTWKSKAMIKGKEHIILKKFSKNDLLYVVEVPGEMYLKKSSEYEVLRQEDNTYEILLQNQNGKEQNATLTFLNPDKISMQYERPNLIGKLLEEELPEIIYERK